MKHMNNGYLYVHYSVKYPLQPYAIQKMILLIKHQHQLQQDQLLSLLSFEHAGHDIILLFVPQN